MKNRERAGDDGKVEKAGALFSKWRVFKFTTIVEKRGVS